MHDAHQASRGHAARDRHRHRVDRLPGSWAYNALLGGLLLPLYGIAAAAGRITRDNLVMFLPFALVVFVNLLETQWADRHADMATGKNTLAARAPATLLRGLAAAATVAAYTLLLLLAPAPIPPLVAGTSMAALPLSVYAAWHLTRHDTPGPAVLAMLVLLAVQLLSWTHLACYRPEVARPLPASRRCDDAGGPPSARDAHTRARAGLYVGRHVGTVFPAWRASVP